MTTTPDRICKYVVEGELARGGMGVVYRATDPALDRAVAIKSVSPRLAGDATALLRFEREAKVLAGLDHPNIASVYGLEQERGSLYLVMELVAGESLASRLRRGAMPIEAALSIGAQIAAGLEVAHEHGIVHRDIKPGNVMILPDDSAKVLDFGLAQSERITSPTQADADTAYEQRSLTQDGMAVGTPGYMSPEQARGGVVDRRTDVFAFGCLLFEMLVGTPPFEGDSAADTVAATLERTPDWSRLPRRIPPRLRELIERCLEKQVRRRQRDMGDVRLELEHALERREWTSTGRAPGLELPPGSLVIGRRTGLAIVVTALTVFLFLTNRSCGSVPESLAVVRFRVRPPQAQQVVGGEGFNPSISADGTQIAYGGGTEGASQLYSRGLGEIDGRSVAGSSNVTESFFSPDGRWLGFVAGGKLMKMAFPSGSPEPIADTRDVRGADWGPDDRIVFSDQGRILRVSAHGGVPELLAAPAADAGMTELRWPHVVSGGRVLVTAWYGAQGTARIGVIDAASGSFEPIDVSGMRPHYLDSRYLVYAQASGALVAVRFDIDDLEPVGEPAQLIEGVASNVFGAPQFSLSDSGSLVYSPDVARFNELALVDRTGASQPLPNASGRAFQDPRFSPGGDRVSVGIDGGIWLYEMSSGTLLRRTDPGVYACWLPDRPNLSFSSNRNGRQALFLMAADGGAEPELLYQGELGVWESEWSPDGEWLVFRAGGPGEIATKRDIFAVRADPADNTPVALLQTAANESMLSISADGRWLAYVSDQTGQREVYVTRFPAGGGSVQVSIDGGTEPSWAHEGGELFYRTPDAIAVAEFDAGSTLRVLERRVLFHDSYIRRDNYTNYDVDPRSGRLLMVRGNTEPYELVVVVNWIEEIRAALGR